MPMNRIMVVGNAGAGKSTFARRLGGKLALPVIHLDSYFWQPGWQTPEPQAWRQQLTELTASPAWVMDGNYFNTFDIRMPRADVLVWLDHPRGTCVRRVLMRTIMGYGRTRSKPKPSLERSVFALFINGKNSDSTRLRWVSSG